MYMENEPVMKRNDAFLNDLPGELYTIEANDKIPDNCKYPMAAFHVFENEQKAQEIYQICLS